MSYIKLDRGISEWEWFTDGNMLKLWIYLLVNAQYQDGSFKGIEVKKGQVITGRKKLARVLNMSEQQIRTCLEHLESTNEITIKPTNRYSLITIVKWAEYQYCDDMSNQQINQQTNQQITSNQPTNNHNTRNIERKKERNIFIRPSLEEVKKYCEERRNGVDPQRWFDYYTSNGWKVGRNSMKDWKAAIRTWEKDSPKEEELKSSERYKVPW